MYQIGLSAVPGAVTERLAGVIGAVAVALAPWPSAQLWPPEIVALEARENEHRVCSAGRRGTEFRRVGHTGSRGLKTDDFSMS